jgi:hypothetical protein
MVNGAYQYNNKPHTVHTDGYTIVIPASASQQWPTVINSEAGITHGARLAAVQD